MSAIPQVRPTPARTRGRATGGADSRPPLRVVRGQRSRADAGHRRTITFLALCMALIVGGLAGGLLLNTQRAQSSFALTSLEQRATELRDERVTLEAEVTDLASPGRLAEEAQDLGMVRSPSSAMVRLSDGSVIGVAAVVEGDRTFTVVTDGPALVDGAESADDASGSSADEAQGSSSQ